MSKEILTLTLLYELYASHLATGEVVMRSRDTTLLTKNKAGRLPWNWLVTHVGGVLSRSYKRIAVREAKDLTTDELEAWSALTLDDERIESEDILVRVLFVEDVRPIEIGKTDAIQRTDYWGDAEGRLAGALRPLVVRIDLSKIRPGTANDAA